MDYIELELDIQPKIEEYNDILSALLVDLDYESFTFENDMFQAYIQKDKFNLESLSGLVETCNAMGIEISYKYKEIKHQNWNEIWESNFHPVFVDDILVVRASFHKDLPKTKYEIVIDPKMSFGTGHHSTTYLMLRSILNWNLSGKQVLDMGCGTGILAIFAAMRNAQQVTAVDIDPICIESTAENSQNNDCADRLTAILGDKSAIENLSEFDFVLANINRNILLNDISTYVKHMKKGAQIALSGFYTEDLDMIKEECERNQLQYIDHLVDKNWVAAVFEK
ncbi:MAG: 50S ribosomal protein L11 methyltransferase [Marinifilaceae bacterium]|jgi:ribosomal protein L11 methyltransferase|nr:50S ribosomal protein L11 methyltransferase [Marinifilaceae bacterium]